MKRHLFALVVVLGLAIGAGCYAWPFDTRPHTYAVALGDLDGDGDLDAYLANGENEGFAKDTVWFNDGSGDFDHSVTQSVGAETHFAVLNDLDGDGTLDALTGCTGGGMVAFNDGKGLFTYSHQRLNGDDSGVWIYFPAVGDLDADGDLDVVLGGCCGGEMSPPPTGQPGVLYAYNMVWLNDGHGHYIDTGQRLGIMGTAAVALGDLDGDGDLDILAANSSSVVDGTSEPEKNQPNTIWLNDGHGDFTDSGQRLGSEESYAVVLGDLDGDGDLDAFVGNRGPNTVWINDGSGYFSDSGQALGKADTRFAALGDLDGDGDLDAYTSGRGYADIWINQGGAQGGIVGVFMHAQQISYSIWAASALGDVDGDGDLDVFTGLLDQETKVWLNDGAGTFVEKR